jgi:transcriptional regulator with XRE-family HTH domain
MAKQVVPTKQPESSLLTDVTTLGVLIRARRTALKMKLEDCAALCGIGINTLSRIENGNPNCTLGATFAVLKGLGIQLADVSTNTDRALNAVDEGWV